MNGEDDGSVVGYMCMVDFECELGAAMGGNRVFPSIEDAKENLKCWRGCGLVEVRVSFVRIVEEGTDQT
jgi:hypothetical protein